jgi:hypothetical protein
MSQFGPGACARGAPGKMPERDAERAHRDDRLVWAGRQREVLRLLHEMHCCPTRCGREKRRGHLEMNRLLIS